MKRLLLVAEGATLAHVGRPLLLARAAVARGFDVTLAVPSRYRWAVGDLPVTCVDLVAQAPEVFALRLSKGQPLYDFGTLDAYVADDLRLLSEVKPDWVVGDFRLSLSVSARLAQVPYATISNAYWSPYYRLDTGWPVPDLPLTRVLPIRIARGMFNLVRPLAFRMHAVPMERLRRKHGLTSLGHDLRRAYTDADRTFYADIPSLFTLDAAPSVHRVVGPLAWAPDIALPAWWKALPEDRRVVYLTMGSSGDASVAAPLALALAEAGWCVMMASAGAQPVTHPLIHVAPFIPGLEACRRADVVVCNGGSPTSQQALLAGKPVVGIPSNLDQYLNMEALERRGVGALMRSDRIQPIGIASQIEALLDDVRTKVGVLAVSTDANAVNAAERILDDLT